MRDLTRSHSKVGLHSHHTEAAITVSDIISFIIKALSLIPGILFIVSLFIGMVLSIGENQPKPIPWLIITMNVMFVVMLLMRKFKGETIKMKGNAVLSFAYFFEAIWFIGMINLL